MVEGPEWAARYDALREARAMRKEAVIGEEAAKQTIIEAMGEYDAVLFDGQPIYNTLVTGRRTLDKKRLAQDYPELDLSRYEKQGVDYRTFKPYLREEP